MEYDEIDQYVDQLFRDSEDRGGEPLTGEVLSGDWRIDRIDQVIQDAYDEAIWWHNKRIETEGNPEGNPSGLRGIKNKLPELPDPGGYDASIYRNGYPQASAATMARTKRGGLSCAEVGLIAAVVTSLIIFMMVMS